MKPLNRREYCYFHQSRFLQSDQASIAPSSCVADSFPLTRRAEKHQTIDPILRLISSHGSSHDSSSSLAYLEANYGCYYALMSSAMQSCSSSEEHALAIAKSMRIPHHHQRLSAATHSSIHNYQCAIAGSYCKRAMKAMMMIDSLSKTQWVHGT